MSELDNLSAVNSTVYTPTTEEALYCSSCWADLKLYPPVTELVFERDFTVNTETVRKVYRYVRTDATEFDRWLAEVKAEERKRIIGLLYAHPDNMEKSEYSQGIEAGMEQAIEIIRRETI